MHRILKALAGASLAITLSLAAVSAHAGLLIEPYLGYQAGSLKTTEGSMGANPNTAHDDTSSGLTFGGRLGITFPLLFIAADYSTTNGKSGSDNMILNQLGATAGLAVPFFRAYLGYSFMNDAKLQRSTGDVTLSGSALKAGVGFTGLPFISLNLEYIMNTFNKYKGPGVDQSIDNSGYLKDAKMDAVQFSVSVPFDI
jgi:hypothetical protein